MDGKWTVVLLVAGVLLLCVDVHCDVHSLTDSRVFRGSAASINWNTQVSMISKGDQVSAMWYTNPQYLLCGFEVSFIFTAANVSSQQGDGLAFVMQTNNANISAIGTGGEDIGYNFPGNVAVEIDYYANSDVDPVGEGPHIAVMSPGNPSLANSPNHATNVLHNVWNSSFVWGTSTVRVKYLVLNSTYSHMVVYFGNSIAADVLINLSKHLNLDARGQGWVGFTASSGASSTPTTLSAFSFAGLEYIISVSPPSATPGTNITLSTINVASVAVCYFNDIAVPAKQNASDTTKYTCTVPSTLKYFNTTTKLRIVNGPNATADDTTDYRVDFYLQDVNECLTVNCGTGFFCNDTIGSYSCIDVNECASNTTNQCNTTLRACQNTEGGYLCGSCPSGYNPSGNFSCTDVNECASYSTNKCNTTLRACQNTEGNYTCAPCPSGYTNNGIYYCQDINECLTSNTCNTTMRSCINTDGGYFCGSCPAGYLPKGNTSCIDLNECASNTTNSCNTTLRACQNTEGNYTCANCSAGYINNGLYQCQDVNECTSGASQCATPLRQCINTDGGYYCTSCPTAYYNNGSYGCIDVDECAEGKSHCNLTLRACVNNVGGYYCATCPPGYKNYGEYQCQDVNECTTGASNCNASSVCINTEGNFSCMACPQGYYIYVHYDDSGYGTGTCLDVNECNTAGMCNSTSLCQNTEGSFNCIACPEGYNITAEYGCIDFDECTSGVDSCNTALRACINTPGSYQCAECGIAYRDDGPYDCAVNLAAPDGVSLVKKSYWSAVFTWEPYNPAIPVYYRVEYRNVSSGAVERSVLDDSDDEEGWMIVCLTSGTNCSVPNLQPGQEYMLRSQACISDGCGNYSSPLLFQTPGKPIISSVSSVPTEGGLLTIYGENFGDNTTAIEVLVDGQTCDVEGIDPSGDSLWCLFNEGTGVMKSVVVIVDALPAITNSSEPVVFSYESPSIDHISTPWYYDQVITISGRNFGDNSSLIIIDTAVGACTNVTILTPQTLLQCRVPQAKSLAVSVSMEVDGNTNTTLSYFDYMFCGDQKCNGSENCINCISDCPSPCGMCGDGHCDYLTGENATSCADDCIKYSDCPSGSNNMQCSGAGACRQGMCFCRGGWGGPSCSTAIVRPTMTVNKYSAAVTITSNSSGYQYEILLISIAELNISGNVIENTYFTNLTFDCLDQQNTTNYQYWLLSTLLPNNALLNITIYIFMNDTMFDVFGEDIDIPPGTLKYNIAVSNWDFASIKDQLRIQIKSNIGLNTTNSDTVGSSNGCVNSTYNSASDNQLRWYKTSSDNGQTLYAQFVDRTLLDGSIQNVSFTLSGGDVVNITIPHFWDYVSIDPNYNVLVDSTQEYDGSDVQFVCTANNSGGKPMPLTTAEIVAIIVVVLVTMLLIAAFLVVYKNRKQKESTEEEYEEEEL